MMSRISAPRIAMAGLACFLASIASLVIKYHFEGAKLQTALPEIPQPIGLGGGFINSVGPPQTEPALLVAFFGLVLFVAASLFGLGAMIRRRITRNS